MRGNPNRSTLVSTISQINKIPHTCVQQPFCSWNCFDELIGSDGQFLQKETKSTRIPIPQNA